MGDCFEDDFDDTTMFENKSGLAEDMRFLASMPELCDVTFLVGDTREPVCAVRAVLAARSKVFKKMLLSNMAASRKREAIHKESKFKAFIKRSSEPLMAMQTQQKSRVTSQISTAGLLPPINESTGQHHQTLIVEEFEPDVFRQLIGLMNAADYYGLDELKYACNGFIQCCITVDTVCALLATAERYIQYKCTKFLIQKVLEYVDDHGNEVLNLGSFATLPQHVVRLIMAREELKADEFSKFQAALMWSKKYCDNTGLSLKEVLNTFLEYIRFHMIPANILMQEIHPLGLVPNSIIMTALAYQADPTSVVLKVSPQKAKKRTIGVYKTSSIQSSTMDTRYSSNTTLSSTNSTGSTDRPSH